MAQIREMYKSDVDTIYNIIEKHKDEFNDFSDTKNLLAYGWSKEQLERWVNSDDEILLVAESEGKIVGFITSRYHKPTNEMLLENIYVLEKYRRMGIGTALDEEFRKRAKEKSVEYIFSNVRLDKSELISFLIKRGYIRGCDHAWLGIIL